MALATIIYTDGSIRPIYDKDSAISLYNVLKGHTKPNDKQAAYIRNVKNVFLPPSWRPAGYDTPDTSHLYHQGVLQGKNSALPLGDQ